MPGKKTEYMQQSQWKNQILSIEEELQGRASSGKSVLLENYVTSLNLAIQDFFESHSLPKPSEPLTPAQNAFMHALQLYDLESTLRLIANYDPTRGVKTLLSGIQKSCQSLSVLLKLKGFAENTGETEQLSSYRQRLEKSLVQVLHCEIGDLYDQKQLKSLLPVVSGLPKKELERFFRERLVALFSVDYRTYLTLKNRYFQLRLVNAIREKTIRNWLNERLRRLLRQDADGRQLKENIELLHYRTMERLVKDLITQFGKTFPLILVEDTGLKAS